MPLLCCEYHDILILKIKERTVKPLDNRTDYNGQAAMMKALSNPIRLQIVHQLLRSGCHNVTCMEQGTGMSQSCVSQHLQKLRAAGLVTARRSGNQVYYRAASEEVARLIAALFQEEASDYVL